MAKQFGALGNADAVLTGYSLLKNERGTIVRVDPKLHSALDHWLGTLKSSRHKEEARVFVEYLLGGAGKRVLQQYGYQPLNR